MDLPRWTSMTGRQWAMARCITCRQMRLLYQHGDCGWRRHPHSPYQRPAYRAPACSTNQIIKQALHPYPDGLVIVSKVGARRGADKSWLHALSIAYLRNLAVESLDVVNLRVGGVMGLSEGSIEEPLTVLAELKREGANSPCRLERMLSPAPVSGSSENT